MDKIKPKILSVAECPICNETFSDANHTLAYWAFDKHLQKEHYEEIPKEKCGRCNKEIDSGGYDDPMFAVAVEIGFAEQLDFDKPYNINSGEEGWEKFVVPMCMDCWDETRAEIEAFLFTTLRIDKRKRFGSWSFHSEFSGEEQPLEVNRGPAPI